MIVNKSCRIMTPNIIDKRHGKPRDENNGVATFLVQGKLTSAILMILEITKLMIVSQREKENAAGILVIPLPVSF